MLCLSKENRALSESCKLRSACTLGSPRSFERSSLKSSIA
ncbi:hypothetical protein V12B01_12865 [Vibrio splendidus 12B01]|nr:hypothetical protein V12B01_12865 [Vibrio splendidus 12B01]